MSDVYLIPYFVHQDDKYANDSVYLRPTRSKTNIDALVIPLHRTRSWMNTFTSTPKSKWSKAVAYLENATDFEKELLKA